MSGRFNGSNRSINSSGAPLPPNRRKTTVASRNATKEKEKALIFMWEGKYNKAEEIFLQKKTTNKDPVASCRYALVHFIRGIVTGDKKIPNECIKRFIEAEFDCLNQCNNLVEQLLPTLEGLNKSKPLARRLSLTVKSIVKSSLKKFNLGQYSINDFEYKIEKQKLMDWRKLQGYASLCCLLRGVCLFLSNSYVKGLSSIKRAFSICKQAMLHPEMKTSNPNALHLVTGSLQLLLANVPPSYVSVLSAIGFKSNKQKGMQMLEHCLRGK